MDETETAQSTTLNRWSWIAAAWLAGGLFDATQSVFIMRSEGHTGSGVPLFFIELALWLPWALATPTVVRFTRRFPLFRGLTLRNAAVHLTAFLVLSAVAEAWSAFLQVQFDPWHHKTPPTFLDTWSVSMLYQILTFAIAYALIVIVTMFMDTREKMARQDEELSKARLAALRRQMEPHFMYNTLNAIAGLVRERSNAAAVNMLVGLSEFLRRASEDSHRSQVSLAEEVEYLQRYLDIQKMRLGDRLQVSMDIPAALMAAQVPDLLLQPLVENAIKHGITQRMAGGAVRVSAVGDGDKLVLRVYNDGPGVPLDQQSTRSGVGLDNLRTRLRILYGNASRLELKPADGGVEVLVDLPLRVA